MRFRRRDGVAYVVKIGEMSGFCENKLLSNPMWKSYSRKELSAISTNPKFYTTSHMHVTTGPLFRMYLHAHLAIFKLHTGMKMAAIPRLLSICRTLHCFHRSRWMNQHTCTIATQIPFTQKERCNSVWVRHWINDYIFTWTSSGSLKGFMMLHYPYER